MVTQPSMKQLVTLPFFIALLMAVLFVPAAGAETDSDLFDAVAREDVKKVESLINSHRNRSRELVNIRDSNGSTPLHRAVVSGNPRLIRLLVAAGADVNAPDRRGYTPLHGAVCNHNRAAVELILSQGGRADLKTKSGQSAGDLALEVNDDELARLLGKEPKGRRVVWHLVALYLAGGLLVSGAVLLVIRRRLAGRA
jgi:ankyrin repeat protein